MDLLTTTGEHNESGGTGTRLGRIVIILAGVSALAATVLTFLSVGGCISLTLLH